MKNQTQSLARTSRPTQFEGPDGPRDQDHVSLSLKRAVATGRIAQAYLLCGPRGVGKTTLARVMAAALNCDDRLDDGEPCGACDSCARITLGRETMDVVEIDAASNRGVDDARQLREQTMYASSREGKYKIYIIDEAHMLTKEAWNSLLKVLEEPPPHVVFFACTTEPDKIIDAVMSRFQRHDLRRVSESAAVAQLRQIAERESIAVDEDALELMAHLSRGGMRDAIGLLDEMRSLHVGADRAITGADIREKKGIPPEILHLSALDILTKGDSEENRGRVFDLVSHLKASGHKFPVFLSFLQNALIALQAVRSGRTPTGPWSPSAVERLGRVAPTLSGASISATMSLALSYRAEVAGPEPEVAFFAFMQSAVGEVARIEAELARTPAPAAAVAQPAPSGPRP